MQSGHDIQLAWALELARMLGHRDLKQLQIYYNTRASELAKRLG